MIEIFQYAISKLYDGLEAFASTSVNTMMASTNKKGVILPFSQKKKKKKILLPNFFFFSHFFLTKNSNSVLPLYHTNHFLLLYIQTKTSQQNSSPNDGIII
jgi:hypothetical protein